MKKQPMPAQQNDAAHSEHSEEDPLVQHLEKMLFEEGLLDDEPRLQRCFFCRELSTECEYHDSTQLEGTLCPACAPIVDRVESFIGERGTGLERHLRVGLQHFLFAKPGRRDGAVLVVGVDAWDEMTYFDPAGLTDEQTIKRLGV